MNLFRKMILLLSFVTEFRYECTGVRRDVNDYNDNDDDDNNVKNWLVVGRFDVFKAVIEISFFFAM